MKTKTPEKQPPSSTAYHVEVKIKLRLATGNDLKLSKDELKIGMPFWVRSLTGEFDNSPQILTADSNLNEIAHWLKYGMIYIPVSSLDAKAYVHQS